MASTQTPEPDTRPSPWAVGVARVLEAPVHLSAGVITAANDQVLGLGRRPVLSRVRAGFARWHWLVAALLYIAGALVMQRHAVAHIATTIAGNLVGDPSQYMWSMWWWPHAILSGVNPFVTHAIWVPDAYNLGSVTSTPLPSILFAPLNALLGWNQGPVVSYNICMLLAPVLSAFFAYRLCLYLSKAPAAAIVGGWLYGFSAYGLSQLQGHMNLVFTFLPVVLLLLSLQRLDGVISRRRFVVLVAVAVAVQIGIGTEIVFVSTCLGIVLGLATLVFAPSSVRRRLLFVVAPELVGAYVIAAVVCSPYIYYALTGPEVEANTNSVLKIADLLSFILPTPIIRIGAYRFASITAGFPSFSGYTETGTYLGLPLIAGACWFWMARWRHWAVRVMLIGVFVAFVWSLGPQLTIDGIGTITLPWHYLEYKSPWNELTPVRVGVYVELGASVAFALWLASPTRRTLLKWLVALLAVAFLFPNVNGVFSYGTHIYSESVESPPFITDGLYRQELRHNEVILPIPFGPDGNSLLWQSQARGYFREASGWFGFYPAGYATSPVMGELLSFGPFTDPFRLMRTFLIAHQVGAVVMLPAQAGPWPGVMSQLGLKRVSVGGVWLYRVPANLAS